MNDENHQRQLAFDRASRGIERAGDHADRESPTWRERAALFIWQYGIKADRRFLIEDAAAWAYSQGLDSPPDGRAWGAAVRLAKSREWIESDGYMAAKSSNMSPKVAWRALI
jgi:hypothetical protein